MPSTDTYPSLQSGLINGARSGNSFFLSSKLHEIGSSDSVLNASVGGSNQL
jgi:TRAP-type C4-dicarboxylate transport system substrate-binding protein